MKNCVGLLAFWLLMVTVSMAEMRVKRQAMATGLVSQDCLRCICEVESGCRPLGCKMDGGSLSCGYFQIKQAYWQDCGSPGGSLSACASNLSCASGCVQKYMQRYIGSSGCSRSCESYARMHNGGPKGCKRSSTVKYWNKVNTCLKRKG